MTRDELKKVALEKQKKQVDAHEAQVNEAESKIKVNYDHLDDKLITQASKTLKLGQSKQL